MPNLDPNIRASILEINVEICIYFRANWSRSNVLFNTCSVYDRSLDFPTAIWTEGGLQQLAIIFCSSLIFPGEKTYRRSSEQQDFFPTFLRKTNLNNWLYFIFSRLASVKRVWGTTHRRRRKKGAEKNAGTRG